MSAWYYLVDEGKRGPVEDAELINLIKLGGFQADTMVSRMGLDDWVPLREVGSLATHIPDEKELHQARKNCDSPPTSSVRHKVSSPAYLYVPVSRMICLSVFSCGAYDLYWMYRNWRYLKNRDNLDVTPGIRSLFGFLFCHQLFNLMYDDSELSRALTPAFYPSVLATFWIIMLIISFLMVDIQGGVAEVMSYLVPRFLCFLPIQRFVNSGNKEMRPRAVFAKWAVGDFVCIGFGALVWGEILVSLIRG